MNKPDANGRNPMHLTDDEFLNDREVPETMCPKCGEIAAIAGKDAILNLSEDAFCDEGSLTQKEIDHIAATVYQAIRALPATPGEKEKS